MDFGFLLVLKMSFGFRVVLMLSVLLFMLKGVVVWRKGVVLGEGCCVWRGCFSLFMIFVVVIIVDVSVVGD